uniref:RteC domain-containing protein n=1 Tax=Albibacterium indicum TaxID=2292082 RepID=UPI000E54A4F6|nr:RteC domain-containing protein [Pedobacter indicus]
MIDYCRKIIEKLDEDIIELTRENENLLVLYEKVVNLVLEQLATTKDFIINRGFKNLEEEIQFFKELKPTILSKLIYYNSIYKIEAKKPWIGERIIESYFNNELSKLKKFFDNNLEFYQYYRTNSTYLDHKYFVRGKHDIKLSLDTCYFESDHSFSTSHDYKTAKILANDLLQVYLEDQLANNRRLISMKNTETSTMGLTWTLSKTDLIELLYALHTLSAFNNGAADIKIIATYFEKTFNIDLGDFYHTFLELRNRKKNPTKFLDVLKEGLLKKMEEHD